LLAVQMVGHNLAMAMLRQRPVGPRRRRPMALCGEAASHLLCSRRRGCAAHRTADGTRRARHGGRTGGGRRRRYGGQGMRVKTAEQSHAPRRRGWLKYGNPRRPFDCTPVRSRDACGDALSRTASAQSATLSDARWCSRKQRAQGNRNAFQYGLYTAEAIAERRLCLLIRQSRQTIEQLKG
jgi:hypothetical protein